MPVNRGRRSGGETRGYAPDDSYDDEDDYAEDTGRARPAESGGRRRLTAVSAGSVALRQIAELTGKDVEGVTLVRPSENGWTVEVEVVEDHRVPSSGDTLGIYAVDLDSQGDLTSYRRVRTYKRARGDTGGVG
ncbi:hypothetical protein Skr01_60870 [Sphaerisporangium krabiense]|uniref:Gas vesicle protein n=1 Tax=Sphaerisporangium krabiense TaxID=763782 RepID=A0A7W9DTY0_9ACTN|nr:gas vesicle protein [Sphaerisporangium krabiense]MBB5631116.1 hypothetical protein [Sphaerisporangium krabiense]GII66002.1 hypothetical protein Skr01_60870 [Sphaerisporangium krabiense]